MRGGTIIRNGLLLALALAVAAPAALAQARVLYGTDSTNRLLRFQHSSPGALEMARAIRGLPAGVKLVGIDFRPRNGDLYGIGSDSKVYRVNPQTAIAVQVDTDGLGNGFGGPLEAPLEGRFFGVDFNPVPDRIRVVSNADQNIRVDPDTGQLTMKDGDINRAGSDPSVAHAAYTDSSFSPTPPPASEVRLYVLDSVDDTLYVQNPPNDGTLTAPTPLGINVTSLGGFDIAGSADVGFVVTQRAAGGSQLWRLNLTTGRASLQGTVGRGAVTLTGLAAIQNNRS